MDDDFYHVDRESGADRGGEEGGEVGFVNFVDDDCGDEGDDGRSDGRAEDGDKFKYICQEGSSQVCEKNRREGVERVDCCEDGTHYRKTG